MLCERLCKAFNTEELSDTGTNFTNILTTLSITMQAYKGNAKDRGDIVLYGITKENKDATKWKTWQRKVMTKNICGGLGDTVISWLNLSSRRACFEQSEPTCRDKKILIYEQSFMNKGMKNKRLTKKIRVLFKRDDRNILRTHTHSDKDLSNVWFSTSDVELREGQYVLEQFQ